MSKATISVTDVFAITDALVMHGVTFSMRYLIENDQHVFKIVTKNADKAMLLFPRTFKMRIDDIGQRIAECNVKVDALSVY